MSSLMESEVSKYRVRFWNPAKPGSGFISGYRRASVAKEVVAQFNALYDKLGHGIRAEYLGKHTEGAR